MDALLGQARARTVAALLRAFGDLDLAQELYQEACVRALHSWPERGVPKDATAWLIRAGYNAGIDLTRRKRRFASADPDAVLDAAAADTDAEQAIAAAMDDAVYRDDILRLLFMCCHPKLQLTDQLALALKVVAGLSVGEIARAFVVTPETMERRLSRAKQRAAAAGMATAPPSPEERAARLKAVSRMLYLMFNEGYSASGGDQPIRQALCVEAIRLVRLLLDLFPGQLETMGLLALMLLQHARHPARLDSKGELVTLDAQNRALWSEDLITEGTVLVQNALRHQRPGPFQLQAAIAAVHCSAKTPEKTDWAEISALYAVLEMVEPSAVVTLNRAVALGKVEGPQAALDLLAPLADQLQRYLPFHAARAGLCAEAGDAAGAQLALQAALRCSPNPAERGYLEARLAEIEEKSCTAVRMGATAPSLE